MPLRVALLLFLSAPAALAGPWPEPGPGTFIAITEDFALDSERGTTSIFVESSAPRRFSIGLDTRVDEEVDDWSAFAFIRQPLTDVTSPDRVSISAGLGAEQTASGTEPLVVLGGTWGRDVENGVSGWLGLEGEARYRANSGETELLGGATIALEPMERIALVNEFSISGVPGSSEDNTRLLTSSIVGAVSSTARIEFGTTLDLSGEAAPGFRLGTWLEF